MGRFVMTLADLPSALVKAKSPPPVTEAKAKKSSKDKGRKKLEKSVPEPAVVAPPTKKKSKSAKAGAGPGATAKPLTRTADHAADNDVGDEDVDDEQAGLNPDFVFDAEPIDTPSWTPHYQLKKGPEFARSTTDDKIARLRAKQPVTETANGSDPESADSDTDGFDGADDQHAAMPAPQSAARKRKRTAPSAAVASDSESDAEDQADVEAELRKKEFFEDLPTEVSGVETFAKMNLSRPLLKAITVLGFERPTEIQSRTIPVALMGRDICACAATGSGKTAAFMLPVLERLLFRPRKAAQTRVLILSPTRELAVQVCEMSKKLAAYTDIQFGLAVGGMAVKIQEAELRARPDVVVATPGRLVDHIQNTYSFDLQSVEILILDEADRLLEVGFQDELKMIIKNTPVTRTTMLFSATMTDEVQDLIDLSLKNPVRLFVNKNTQVTSNLVQEFIRIRENREECREAIVLSLCKRALHHRVLVFVQAKKLAHRLRIIFGLAGLKAGELHGSLTQAQRLEALERFKARDVDFLICTDLAARGLDIPGTEAVINVSMPHTLKQYIHRVGRTARGQAGGRSVTLVGENERKILRDIIKDATGTLKSRIVPPEVIVRYQKKVEEFEDSILAVLRQEKEEGEMAFAEMEVRKAQNLLEHADEIYARAPRQWIVGDKEKTETKELSKQAYQGQAALPSEGGSAKGKQRPSQKRKRDEDPAMAAAIRQAKRARKPKRIYAVEPDKEPVAKTNKPKTTKKHLGFAADKADVRKGKGQDKQRSGAGKAAGPKRQGGGGKTFDDIPKKSGTKAFKSKKRFKRR